MQRLLKWVQRIGAFSILWSIGRWLWNVVLNHIGNAQTLWEIVKDWPTYLKVAALILGSQWFPLVLAILCLVAWFLLSRRETRVIAQTANPGIRVSCGRSVDKSIITAKGITFFRARLELDGPEPIRYIRGHVTDIRMDGEKMQLNEEAQLRLHPGYPELEELREGVAGFLDVVQVEKDGRPVLSLAVNYASVDPWSFFKNGHETQISVSITGSMKTQAHTFIFDWTGDRQTAGFELEANSKKNSDAPKSSKTSQSNAAKFDMRVTYEETDRLIVGTQSY